LAWADTGACHDRAGAVATLLDVTRTPDPKRAFRDLVVEHFDFVWRLLRRLGLSAPDADDAAQHVFMTAIAKLPSITRGSERSFLYGVALRVAQNHKRKIRRRRQQAEFQELEQAADLVDFSAQPDEAACLREARTLLDRLLATLPDELRRVLVLAEVEQLEVAEIAALERIPVGTAASRLRRARANFRDALAAAEGEHPFRVVGT
jgi:RNA polymerase sigma-70 factor, ECF subfamily